MAGIWHFTSGERIFFPATYQGQQELLLSNSPELVMEPSPQFMVFHAVALSGSSNAINPSFFCPTYERTRAVHMQTTWQNTGQKTLTNCLLFTLNQQAEFLHTEIIYFGKPWDLIGECYIHERGLMDESLMIYHKERRLIKGV